MDYFALDCVVKPLLVTGCIFLVTIKDAFVLLPDNVIFRLNGGLETGGKSIRVNIFIISY